MCPVAARSGAESVSATRDRRIRCCPSDQGGVDQDRFSGMGVRHVSLGPMIDAAGLLEEAATSSHGRGQAALKHARAICDPDEVQGRLQ